LSALARTSETVSRLATKRGFYLGARSTKVHVAIYRLTSGRLGGHVPGLPQARIALIDHTGAKSGKRRTSPLMYCVKGEGIAVVASKGGQPTHPAWYHNLKANPETTVQLRGERRPVRARVADGEERAELWDRCVALFAGYETYRETAAPREIPIVVLEPLKAG